MKICKLICSTVLLVGMFNTIVVAEDIPALKDVFKDDFLIGTSLVDDIVRGRDHNAVAIVKKHFNAITPDNVMKWDFIHTQPKKYEFDAADRFVDFGRKNNMFIIGHTLIWHDQTPGWVFKDNQGKQLSRDELLERMKDHISTIVGRYKGKVNGWDVVNEVLDPNGSLRNSKWLEIIGEDYIAKAFEYAHEADPNAELYYNDYSIENPEKREGVIRILKDLKAKNTYLTAVGIQGQAWRLDKHYPTTENIEAIINAVAELGYKVMITELTIDVLPNAAKYEGADIKMMARMEKKLNPYPDGLPDDVQQRLADRYAELFGIFVKHKDKISRVTVWGIYDGKNWLNDWPIKGRTSYPLLFDRNYQPKPAFFAVVKTAESK
ncbi:MAG: endo-1,4-beta-xylanase [Sedimentisphaerales bacterium]|nr:endo-1,4-beta-xylanase [Sedimentisphaerales bacterium]